MKPNESNEQQEKVKGILASAKRAELLDRGVTVEHRTDWEKIGQRIGIIVSVITILSFIFSCMVFLYTIQKDMRDYYDQQLNRVIDLTNRQTKMETQIETLQKQITNDCIITQPSQPNQPQSK
ncbi:hypothetical protein A3K34_02060 [candidate division WWE3 bacterium RIFOXYC1_FULL_40_10]|uniref:Uncharacterized protein n=1 Tax=candidate division WWE3 bacterium RIFOXYA2_FULL_46_9 TaxID=1802636 RepID=A0A1F4W001_UNCKA|nr:MAG: hypothetical protein A3K58_02060 [candidate division WWE3 bacterium RIFOXYB1_FULL_40_22]OGC61640.1 MAG: hypothetical protein A3K37_02060 [candidate division WWE3 bacterium RIFOXYA1_FULL_40_11]OGC62655.1 MAG: hypothetical protein A2264_02155 [candidate division WWE3 bacterium RIFOXYA2_FULL_46_9]OGC64683.1 MAG: hypothetical protein A2326_01385 [candidate division WWE3 bacterium RIFOXYB2_FULL_41_6]OGC66023.1 MAG: hypothetical protein A3K34_02060 [candidate division WWE3 bacterium RIFOXYC1_